MDNSRFKGLAEAYAQSMADFETPLVFTTRTGERGTGEYFDAKWAAAHAGDSLVHDNVVILPVPREIPEEDLPYLGQLAAGS